MRQSGIEYYVFCNDAQKRLGKMIDDPRLTLVTPDTYPPRNLDLMHLVEPGIRTGVWEYLARCSIEPRADLVATCGGKLLEGDPDGSGAGVDEVAAGPRLISLKDLLEFRFNRGLCYGVKLGDPRRLAPGWIDDLHGEFRVGSDTLAGAGPLGGSVIVEREAYRRFQSWFEQVVGYLFNDSRRDRDAELLPTSGGNPASTGNTSTPGCLLESAIAYYFGQTFENRLVSVTEKVNDNRKDPELQAAVDDVPGERPIVIAFANSRYKVVLRNWVAAMGQLRLNNFLIVAMDRETQKDCTELGIPCYLSEADGTAHRDVMRVRVRTFRELTKMGVDFINSDLDALWIRNPLPYLQSLDGDLLVSQGTIQPPEILERWGFVLCSGFFMSRASRRMRIFYDLMIEDDRGDQISMSHALLRDNVQFEILEPYPQTFQGSRIACSRQPIYGASDNFRVAVLPHHLFQRIVGDARDALVVHPYSRKDQADKLQSFKDAGCYFLS